MSEPHVPLQSLTPTNVKQLSRQQKLQILQRHRESRTRNANVVFLIGTDVLAGGASGISQVELYDIYEQIILAALDCGRVSTAREYLSILQKRFGKSSLRLRHLEGLCLEAAGRPSDAQALYAAVLKDAPTDAFAVQRLSAMLKSEGKYREAIEVIEKRLTYTDEEGEKHTYLDVHRGGSVSVYGELSNLHYLCGDIEKALVYADEAMLFSGNSYIAHTRLAELYYIDGNLKHCIIEYSQSLRLNDHSNNSRAAYGLWVATNDVVRQCKSTHRQACGEEIEEAMELRKWAGNKLLNMYTGSPMLASVEAILQREA